MLVEGADSKAHGMVWVGRVRLPRQSLSVKTLKTEWKSLKKLRLPYRRSRENGYGKRAVSATPDN